MDYIKEYMEYLDEVKHVSDNTKACVKRDLEALRAYLSDSFPGEDGADNIVRATPTVLNGYLMALEQGTLSKATVARRISTVRGFYRFLLEKHYIDTLPIQHLKTGKITAGKPQVLTEEEVDRLLAAPAGSGAKALRDKAMLELLYATGIKATELVCLKVSDVNLAMCFLTCGGSAKERLVPFGQSAARALEAYINKGRTELLKGGDTEVLFISTHGKAMSRQGFWKLVKKYGKQAGIEKDITCDCIRHSFAVHLIENGADIKSVQEMLGHTSVSTTMFYAGNSAKRVREEYLKAHPRK